ncbi:hypothetical protein SMICM17S_12485 [Streptomyces microflavus]
MQCPWPEAVSFSGTVLGQLAMIVFGVLVVGTEYSSGMIRTSLAAVPQRGTLLFSKIAVAGVLALLVGLLTSFVSFFLGQALLELLRAPTSARRTSCARWSAPASTWG